MSHKKKPWKRIAAAGLLAVTLLSASGTSAYAAGKDKVYAVFPVRQIFDTGEEDKAEESFQAGDGKNKPENIFEYEMTALEKENPMPKGSMDGVYLFTMKDTEDKKIGPVEYSHGGVYRYQVKQRISREKENYIYDKAVYEVEVYVKNRSWGLDVEMFILNKEGSKCETMEFENKYIRPAVKPTPKPEVSKPVKTGDENRTEKYMAMLLLAIVSCIAVFTAGRKIRK